MSTNFYEALRDKNSIVFRGQHIGKRGAAGMYCWDCKVTLCRGGRQAIHSGGKYILTHPYVQWRNERAKEWFDSCQGCGQKALEEPLHKSSVGLELGFNHTAEVKHGVASCSSFTWDIEPGAMEGIDEIVYEYGELYTFLEFAEMLKSCPIRYTELIGRDFS